LQGEFTNQQAEIFRKDRIGGLSLCSRTGFTGDVSVFPISGFDVFGIVGKVGGYALETRKVGLAHFCLHKNRVFETLGYFSTTFFGRQGF
jgi:hypothetical protein